MSNKLVKKILSKDEESKDENSINLNEIIEKILIIFFFTFVSEF